MCFFALKIGFGVEVEAPSCALRLIRESSSPCENSRIGDESSVWSTWTVTRLALWFPGWGTVVVEGTRGGVLSTLASWSPSNRDLPCTGPLPWVGVGAGSSSIMVNKPSSRATQPFLLSRRLLLSRGVSSAGGRSGDSAP